MGIYIYMLDIDNNILQNKKYIFKIDYIGGGKKKKIIKIKKVINHEILIFLNLKWNHLHQNQNLLHQN